MINEQRRDIISELEKLSELAPDFRFGQMISGLAHLAAGNTVEAIYDVEDDQLLAAIRGLIENLSTKEQGVA